MRPTFDAYGEIKSRILSLAYEPGEKLSEARVAAELDVGRSPIRTALQRLEMEGWVVVRPQSGTVVSELGVEDVFEICELRSLLESHAIANAARQLSDDDIGKLRAAHQRLLDKGLVHDRDARDRFNTLLFETIYDCAQNNRILQVLRNLREQISWIRNINATDSARVTESVKELGEMITALEARAPEKAAELSRQHARNIAEAFAKLHASKFEETGTHASEDN